MSNRKATFAKRSRELALKDKARDKEARRAARKADSEGRVTKGPEIAWDQAHQTTTSPDPPHPLPPSDDQASDDSSGNGPSGAAE